MTVRDTSRTAYLNLTDTGKLGCQQQTIMQHIKPGHDYSLRELCAVTGLEINAVSGRCNDLKKLGLLEEGAARPCKVSGRTIHPVRLPRQQGELF